MTCFLAKQRLAVRQIPPWLIKSVLFDGEIKNGGKDI